MGKAAWAEERDAVDGALPIEHRCAELDQARVRLADTNLPCGRYD